MCGICGVASPSLAPVSPEPLRAMNAQLVHRGPDDEGLFAAEQVGLAMRRLSVIDVAGGAQPIFNEDRTVAVVFNGEIYNFQALREILVQAGHRFTTQSDTEVIAHAYEAYGEDCVQHLRGMFAFAVWDVRRRRLWLARDRFGIKPLYYTLQQGTLIFASELKALLAHPQVARELDPEAVDCYFAFGYIPAPRTIFRHIRKLEPATRLLWENGAMRQQRYWELDYTQKFSGSFDEGRQQLRERLREAVRSHLISDVPLGAFLSGGVDSSTVVSLMHELGHQPLKTFALGFREAPDELSFARAVAKRVGSEHHELIAEPAMMDLLPQLVQAQGEPLFDNSILPTYLIAQLARRHVTVALSGDGGDELFAGYAWTQRYHFVQRYQQLPAAARRVVHRVLVGPGYVPGYERGLRHQARRFLHDAAGTLEEGFARRTLVSRSFRHWLYTASFQRELHGFDAALVQRQAFARARVQEAEEAMLAVDMQLFLPDDCLAKVDRMSMAHSLEVRVPLLDQALVEFAARLPWEWKLSGTTTKFILKEAMAESLPSAVLKQRKQGFTVPIAQWLRGRRASALHALLSDEQTRARGILNPKMLQWMWEAHQRGTHDFSGRLWAAAVFELWARG